MLAWNCEIIWMNIFLLLMSEQGLERWNVLQNGTKPTD